jgi:hypothetical protein
MSGASNSIRKTFKAIVAVSGFVFAGNSVIAAEWIGSAQAKVADVKKAPIALQFRREITVTAKPRSFPVRVSADQRFVLYVNGERIAAGPARGDLLHWRYETIDLAAYLKKGANVIGAQVWGDGRAAPLAQISSGTTGFYIAAENADQAALIDSGSAWSVRVDGSRTVSAGMPQLIQQVGATYYAAGAPEKIDASLQMRDWNQLKTVVSDWQPAVPLTFETAPWQLVASAIPQMRYDKIDSGRLVRAKGVETTAFPKRAVTIPANTEAALLIDAGRLLAAYPVLRTSQGAGAEVKLTYTESLYDPAQKRGGYKGGWVRFADRDHVGDGLTLGLTDNFKPDGGVDRLFQPFWWRVWRFVEIKIKTADHPLTLEGFDTFETGYPFQQRGRFISSDSQLNEIWRIGWMTGLLDAHETYMDTAYWEQLQYIGDTRIQMLLSYEVSGDPRLAIQAIDAFAASRHLEGVPQSAWPSTTKNLIPPFALLWVGTLHDYWMRQPDAAVVTRNLPAMRSVFDWFAPYVNERGLLGAMPGWPFIDWAGELDGAKLRNTGKGPDSCVITLMYYGALREAAEMEDAMGDVEYKNQNLTQAERVKKGLELQCWDEQRGLFADTPDKATFSQHANVLAVLYDVVPKAKQAQLLDKIILPAGGIDAPNGITASTYYFSFYLARALEHAGLGDRYLDLLQSWRKLLAQNFTTWPETPDPTRSDSHAWSAHPTSGLLTYVAGIQTAAPGFARVRIEPHLGELTKLDAAMAHPKGLIETEYKVKNKRLTATVKLPKGIDGEFVWAGVARPLKGGTNRIEIGAEQ